MTREDFSPDRVPAEVREYMAAIQELHDRPFVQQHFYQVTQLSVLVPQQQRTDLVALEFRDGTRVALIWKDGRGNWRAGAWLKLPHPDADITCAPTPVSLEYFQDAQLQSSLVQALELLAATKPRAEAAVEERLTTSPPPSVSVPVTQRDASRSGAAFERLSIQADHREYMTRLVFSLVTAIIIASTAYICAWYEYRAIIPRRISGDLRPITLWQFANAGTWGIAAICFLAGALAFPLCFLGSRRKPGTRPSLGQILVVHGVTAVFAILVAVVISFLHIPSGH
jgi:hypothetical protein